MKKIMKAYYELLELIEQGYEYPDAHIEVCLKYNLTTKQGDQVQDLYDEQ